MNDFERCLKVLRKGRVRFVVTGGAAAAAQGSTYVTYDLDICYERSPANVRRLVIALDPYHPRLRGAPEGLPFRFDEESVLRGMNFPLATELGDLGLFGEVTGIGSHKEARALSVEMKLFGRSHAVLSLEGLIKSKRSAGRTKDLLVIPELESLREIPPRSVTRSSRSRRLKR